MLCFMKVLGTRVCTEWTDHRKSRRLLIWCRAGGAGHRPEGSRPQQTQRPTVPHGMGKTHFAFYTKSYAKCFETDPNKLQARPLLEAYAVDELVDPRLGSYAEGEVYCMLHAASLCIRRDPQERPRMSQVRRQ